jgi:hypothetical protein
MRSDRLQLRQVGLGKVAQMAIRPGEERYPHHDVRPISCR